MVTPTRGLAVPSEHRIQCQFPSLITLGNLRKGREDLR